MRVSVIITTYNSAATIRRTIDSVLAQEGAGVSFELEVIVVDDCSRDSTVSVVAEYEGVTLLQSKSNSGGPNRGRNIGLERCTGDAITIADHDDEWLPDRLSKQIPHLRDYSIVTGGFIVVDEDSGRRDMRVKSCIEGVSAFAQNETFLDRLSRRPSGQTTYLGTLLYRSSLKHIRFEEAYGVVDFDWIVRTFEGQSSAEVCAPLYLRHVFGSNLSLDEKYRLRDYEYSNLFLEGFETQYPSEVRLGIKRVTGTLARYYYTVGKMPEARRYLRRAGLSPKHLLYWLTTWVGSSWVNRRFRVFG